MVAPKKPSSYQKTFGSFIQMLRETKEQVVTVHHQDVLADSFDELVESLNRLADKENHLVIVPRHQR